MKSFPFDSQISGYDDNGLAIYDRAANSDILAAMLDRFFASGIVPDNNGNLGFFVGESSTALQTIVNPGYVIIKGRCGWEEDVQIMTHNAPDATYDRIDRIVLRKSTEINERQISMVLLTGTPATSPVAPALTRNNSVWEIAIADVLIKKNISTISQANISDLRLSTELCGISEVPLKVFNTTQLYSQIQSDLAEFKANEQAAFLAWVESIKNVLDENTAGNLLNQINAIKGDVDAFKAVMTPTDEGIDLGGRYIDNALFR